MPHCSPARAEGVTTLGRSSGASVVRVDDLELLAAIGAGDEAAFTELVRRYHPSLVKVARYYVGSDATANDVAQETWMAVVRGIDRFEGRSSFKTWLLRICVNRARSIGTREHRQVPIDPTEQGPSVPANRFDEGGAWTDPPTPFSDSIDEAVSNAELVAAVRGAISALGDPQQSVVTLRDVEGLSTQEVAELLGLSVANVRVILHRGRAKVRELVEHQMRGVDR